MSTALPSSLDVLVLGTGPAGAVIAASLAPTCRVALVGRAPGEGRVIGESLPSAAGVVLAELGLWEAFRAQGHHDAATRLSLWGGDDPVQRDAIQDPRGAGWHLDRRRFDELLRQAAAAAGARLVQPAELRQLEHAAARTPHPWRCRIDTAGGRWEPACKVVVDATGRSARVVRQAGVDVVRGDGLACVHTWLAAPPGAPSGATIVESAPDGWWYGATLPDGSRVIAWHSDGDLDAIRRCRSADDLLAQARRTTLIAAHCAGARPVEPLRSAPARSQWPRVASGADWLAVGDASLAFDPLASQGLLHALVTGRAGARAVTAHLDGDATALPAWASWQRGIARAYRANLAACYDMEQRWPDAAFWRRRHGGRVDKSLVAAKLADPAALSS